MAKKDESKELDPGKEQQEEIQAKPARTPRRKSTTPPKSGVVKKQTARQPVAKASVSAAVPEKEAAVESQEVTPLQEELSIPPVVSDELENNHWKKQLKKLKSQVKELRERLKKARKNGKKKKAKAIKQELRAAKTERKEAKKTLKGAA